MCSSFITNEFGWRQLGRECGRTQTRKKGEWKSTERRESTVQVLQILRVSTRIFRRYCSHMYTQTGATREQHYCKQPLWYQKKSRDHIHTICPRRRDIVSCSLLKSTRSAHVEMKILEKKLEIRDEWGGDTQTRTYTQWGRKRIASIHSLKGRRWWVLVYDSIYRRQVLHWVDFWTVGLRISAAFIYIFIELLCWHCAHCAAWAIVVPGGRRPSKKSRKQKRNGQRTETIWSDWRMMTAALGAKVLEPQSDNWHALARVRQLIKMISKWEKWGLRSPVSGAIPTLLSLIGMNDETALPSISIELLATWMQQSRQWETGQWILPFSILLSGLARKLLSWWTRWSSWLPFCNILVVEEPHDVYSLLITLCVIVWCYWYWRIKCF